MLASARAALRMTGFGGAIRADAKGKFFDRLGQHTPKRRLFESRGRLWGAVRPEVPRLVGEGARLGDDADEIVEARTEMASKSAVQ